MALVVKNPPANADIRDASSIPGSGISPGEGHGNPLQYSCMENPMDRGTWWTAVHAVSKSQTRFSDQTTMNNMCLYMLCVCILQTIWRWSPEKSNRSLMEVLKHLYCNYETKYPYTHSFILQSLLTTYSFQTLGRQHEQVTASVLGQNSGRNRWLDRKL